MSLLTQLVDELNAGSLKIVDLGSRNGTRLNGEAVTTAVRARRGAGSAGE